MGRNPGFISVKLRNLRTGNVLDRRFRSGEQVERVVFENRKMQYLYKDDTGFVFMDTETYEQFTLPTAVVEDREKYMKINSEVEVSFYKSEPVLLEIGDFAELEVIDAPPGVKGNTATGATKQVTLETGLLLNVPLFIDQGDILRIDTRTREYVTRV